MNTPNKYQLELAANRFVIFNNRAVRFEDSPNKSYNYASGILEMLDDVLTMLDIVYNCNIKYDINSDPLSLRMNMMGAFVAHNFSAFRKYATLYRRFIEEFSGGEQ